MMIEELTTILHRMNASIPPSDLESLAAVASIDWNKAADLDVNIASEVLLRVSADLILVAFDEEGSSKERKKALFWAIDENIRKSDMLGRSKEFASYVESFRNYLSDI